MFLSLDPETIQRASFEKATDKTKSLCPSKEETHLALDLPPERSQILRVLSREPLTSVLPSGEKDTE